MAEIVKDKKFLELHQWRESLFGGLEWTTGLLVSGMEYWNGLLPNEGIPGLEVKKLSYRPCGPLIFTQ